MTEQESSGFTVVDKRSASQPAATSTEAAPPPDPAVSASTAPETDMHDGESSPSSSDASTPETASAVSGDETDLETMSSAEPDESDMPDPALLLSMIGMQMETRMLATALIAIFDGHAWRSMGFIANPATGEVRKDLPSAQLAIDTVAFLLGKVESSLPDNERRDAQRRLSDLRMNYLNKLRE